MPGSAMEMEPDPSTATATIRVDSRGPQRLRLDEGEIRRRDPRHHARYDEERTVPETFAD